MSQFSSVTQSCLILCDPMNRSTPGLPVHHQLPEFTQTHVHWVSDAIQHLILCRPLLLLPPSPSQHQSLFQWVNFAWGAQSTGVSALASFLKCLADIKKLNKIWGNSLHVNYPGYLQDIRYLCSRNAIQLFWHLKIQNTPYYRNALYRTVPLPLRPTEQKPQGRLEVNFEELIGVSQVYNKGSKMICWMNEKKPDFSCLFTFLKKLLV